MKNLLFVLLFLACCSWSAAAAPLFPDVPEQHWARDAVASLAAKGLLEGYPDGTFKGDRAASRWELAMVVARLLSKMEAQHATFASRAELEEVRKLAHALRQELDALGVRVTNLEEATSRLDRRVTELERITFYGTLDARVVMHSFTNNGVSDNDSLRGGGGLPGGLPYVNYDQVVGTSDAGLFRPQINGVLPVMDYLEGRLLSNGTGFTTRGLLGVQVKVSPDIEAGMELVGYSSQGDLFVDGYWGLNAPYTAHAGSGNVGAGGVQPLDHTPYTRMVLDRFWLRHKPSNTKVVLGNLEQLKIAPLVYEGQANASLDGPRRLNYGFSVSGEAEVSEQDKLVWEVFHSRIGTRNVFQATNYELKVFGGDLAFLFNDEAGKVQLNFARVADEAIGGAPLVTGLLGFNNVAYGASSGWSPFQWVNPPGYFAAQRSEFEQQNSGGALIGLNTVDKRPIPGWNGTADNAIGVPAGGGNYGPQAQNTYGVNASYRWDFNQNENIRLGFDYNTTHYRPNRNSPYESRGDLWRVEVSGAVLEGDLRWDLSYVSIDPRYNPTRFRNGLVGARFPSIFNVVGAFHTYDSNNFPHNREGLRAGVKWSFDDKRGLLYAEGDWLRQKETSLYDVRVLPGALGSGTPNFPVIGYSPGFIDYVFAGYAHPNLYGGNSATAFTANLTPLEDPRGRHNRYEFGGRYRWREPDVAVTASYRHMDFRRSSALSPAQGGSQNLVDIDTRYFHFDTAWRPNDVHKLTAGLDYVRVSGHHDPAGIYNAYAARIGSTDFDNIDSVQTIPFVAFDWQLDERTDWNVTASYYDTDDRIGSQVTGGRAFDTIGSSLHPFDWGGWQVTSQISLKF